MTTTNNLTENAQNFLNSNDVRELAARYAICTVLSDFSTNDVDYLAISNKPFSYVNLFEILTNEDRAMREEHIDDLGIFVWERYEFAELSTLLEENMSNYIDFSIDLFKLAQTVNVNP